MKAPAGWSDMIQFVPPCWSAKRGGARFCQHIGKAWFAHGRWRWRMVPTWCTLPLGRRVYLARTG